MSYTSDKAIEIAKKIIDNGWDEQKISTCDARNWDTKLHIHFTEIARELRGMGFMVTVSVNHGVHDWVIIKTGEAPKEVRVFVLSANEIQIDGGYAIDSWNDYEQAGDPLPEEAQKFIKLAEEKGTVYSLKGFMVAYNINEEVGANDYVFITKTY